MRIIAASTIAFIYALPVYAQNLSGIYIGDYSSVLNKIEGEKIAENTLGHYFVTKYRLTTGNELSITVDPDTKRIVYMENDWGSLPLGKISDYPDFVFGETRLNDIRKKLGSAGIAYDHRPPAIRMNDEVIMTNTYQISGVLVTFFANLMCLNFILQNRSLI